MNAERRVHVVISGRVQGVGYRAWAADSARRHQLSGWVRNRRDGSVEAVLAGPAEAVDAMLIECRGGPPAAGVAAIDTRGWDEPLPAGFHVLPTT